MAAAPAHADVAAVQAPAPERDEQGRVVRRWAEDVGTLALPAQDRPRRAGAELDGALAVPLALADPQRAQLGAGARRLEVAALDAGELLAAQARVAEDYHDGEISGAGERLVDDRGLCDPDELLVLLRAERLRRLARRYLGPRQLNRERRARLRRGDIRGLAGAVQFARALEQMSASPQLSCTKPPRANRRISRCGDRGSGPAYRCSTTSSAARSRLESLPDPQPRLI